MIRRLALVFVGCGSPAATPPPPPAPAPALSHGADLAGPIAVPTVATGATHAPSELEHAIAVGMPAPPVGGTVGFTFGDAHTGWVARLPKAPQLPALAYGDGRIYVSGGFDARSFYALDAATGHLAWATEDLEDNGPTAAIFDEGRVLFNTESCTLFALDATTGKRLWHRFLGDPTLAQVATADGLVYAGYPDNGAHLGAFRTSTGEPVWSHGFDGELLAAPVIAGDAVYIATTGGTTYRFARATGRVVWAQPLRATTAPWIDGEELFVARRAGGEEEQIVAAASTGAVLRTGERARGGGIPSDQRELWAFEGSRPVVANGMRYAAMGTAITASDTSTGAVRWQRYTKAKLGSTAVVGSQVVVATRDGAVFGLAGDTGTTLWAYALGHRLVAEPIIARGWLYAATTDGYVIALGVGDTTLDGWHMFGGNARHDGPVSAPPRRRETASL